MCRVYDIGEIDGEQYISMEYIDGEDLAALIRRIGRLSRDKAVQIARQLCAGLAAAHAKGVLHRDLKPHNVMIDGEGRVRITDFGLAGYAADFAADGADVGAGTPAYMAPEHLAGKGVSVASDIYSLGLVLYEIFTGTRAFGDKGTSALLDRLHGDVTPTTPSSIAEDIDPAVERVILRCLERDPRQRPASALAVAAALPGGDPLAAALAAGETPSPDIVAAAGEVGGLRPAIAWTLLATLGVLLVLGVLISDRASPYRQVPLEKPPEVLADIAAGLIKRLGYIDPPGDSAYGFTYDREYLRHVRQQERAPEAQEERAAGAPNAITFWYRQSPQPLAAKNLWRTRGWSLSRVSLTDPPASLSGMAGVRLDSRGRLLEFHAVPPQVAQPETRGRNADWSALFAQAGLDPARLTAVPSTWSPPVYADTRAAWEVFALQAPETPVRVEAAACHGKPVYFQVIMPWTRPHRDEPPTGTMLPPAARAIFRTIWYVVLIGAAVLAIRNLRLGRADRRGAFRLALFILALDLLSWLFRADHVWDVSGEADLLATALMRAFNDAVRYWLYYLALEPYVRRLWPQALISWSRVLAGRVRDPLVGRDLLVGGLFGVFWNLLDVSAAFAAGWLGLPLPDAQPMVLEPLLGGRHPAGALFDCGGIAVFWGLMPLMLFLILRAVLRKQRPAAVVLFLVFTAFFGLGNEHGVYWLVVPLLVGSGIFLLVRFGLWATVAGLFAAIVLDTFPVTLDFSAWYIGASLTALATIAGLAVYGFYTSLAGRPLFGDDLLKA
jgi:serine/threonine-protein kinase